MSAMLPDFRITCTTLHGLNKQGKLQPQSDGYYEVVLSAVDYPNSVGAIYRSDSAEKMLLAGSALQRRVKDGQLFGEWGHPKPDGMSPAQYGSRLHQVYEERTSHHIREIWIERNGLKDRNGKSFVGIMGLVTPQGELGDKLRESFENPHNNTAFSVRAITDNYMIRSTGMVEKEFVEGITWDAVGEPGLKPASKHCAPSLESYLDQYLDMPIDQRLLTSIIDGAQRSPIALESNAIEIIYRTREKLIKLSKSDSDRISSSRSRWLDL